MTWRHDGRRIRRYSVRGQWRRAFAMLRSIAVVFAMLGALVASAAAQEPSRSECLAMANVPPRATPVSLRRLAAKTDEVVITYAGHSTYYIDTPGGVRIATDFSGAYRTGRLPDVVTMNRAHSTHYTLFPDSHIPHVFHGWGDDGQPAKIAQRIGDVFIRNVTTDIRRYFGDDSNAEMIRDGNSIFIFEVAGLCIGHLGHLHHKLDESHFAQLHDVARRHFGNHAAIALFGRAADASLHDTARRLHAPDRPAVRDRCAGRAKPDDFAGRAAGHADGHHSRWGLKLPAFKIVSAATSTNDVAIPACVLESQRLTATRSCFRILRVWTH